MTIDEIRWMAELFKTNNMSRAAENLYISQPALSQCLQRVERQLGFSLFTRSNKGLIPTERGELFYKTALDISDTYQGFLGQVEALDRKKLSSICIGMPLYLSMMCSSDLLIDLHQTHPEIHFSIIESNDLESEKLIKSNSMQILISKEPATMEGLVAHPFSPSPAAIFLRKGSLLDRYAYKKDGRRYLDPIYLEGEPLSLTPSGQSTRLLADLILEEARVRPNIIQESRHVINLYRYAADGISSSISLCAFDVLDLDKDDQLIYYIPEKYRYHQIHYLVCLTPELDRIMPKDIIDIIQHTGSRMIVSPDMIK